MSTHISALQKQPLITLKNCTLFAESVWPKPTINAGSLPAHEQLYFEIEVDSPYDMAEGQGSAGWLADPLPFAALSKKNYYWRRKKRERNRALDLSAAYIMPKPVMTMLQKPSRARKINSRQTSLVCQPVQNTVYIKSLFLAQEIANLSVTSLLNNKPAFVIDHKQYRPWHLTGHSSFGGRKLRSSYTSALARIFIENKIGTSAPSRAPFSFFKPVPKPQTLGKAKIYSDRPKDALRPVLGRKSAPGVAKINRIVKPSLDKKSIKQTSITPIVRPGQLNYPDFTLFLSASQNTALENNVTNASERAKTPLSYPDFSLHCFNLEQSCSNTANPLQAAKSELNYPDLFRYAPNGIYSSNFFKPVPNKQPNPELSYADYSLHCASFNN